MKRKTAMIRTLVTGYPSQENAREAANRGADDYIVKPYTMEDLILRIKEVIPALSPGVIALVSG